jgi:hypothetical protein
MALKILRSKGIREYLVDCFNSRNSLKKHPLGTVLIEQLPTSATRHQWISLTVNASKCNELTASGAKQLTYKRAFRTKRKPVGSILNVNARDDATIVTDCSSTNREL